MTAILSLNLNRILEYDKKHELLQNMRKSVLREGVTLDDNYSNDKVIEIAAHIEDNEDDRCNRQQGHTCLSYCIRDQYLSLQQVTDPPLPSLLKLRILNTDIVSSLRYAITSSQTACFLLEGCRGGTSVCLDGVF